MATPVGHSIVGYTVARAAGLKSRRAIALAIGAACLPDIDFLMGYVTNRDPRSLHHEVITHKSQFPWMVGVAVGAAAAVGSLLRGRPPMPKDVIRPAALATALVGTHVAMDPLPLPYDTMPPRSGNIWEVFAGQAWNAVIDMAVYGIPAVLAGERMGSNGHTAEA